MLAANLLAAVGLYCILRPALAFILTVDGMRVAKIHQGANDLVIRDAVLGKFICHFVELAMHVVDVWRDRLDLCRRVGDWTITTRCPGQCHIGLCGAHLLNGVHDLVMRLAILERFADIVGHPLLGAVPLPILQHHTWQSLAEDTAVKGESHMLRTRSVDELEIGVDILPLYRYGRMAL